MAKQQSKQKSRIKKINCLSCKSNLSIRAIGYINTLVCSYCGTSYFVDAKGDIKRQDGGIKPSIRSRRDFDVTPMIPLGTRGKLKGTTWEVIGFLRRREIKYEFTWDEYLLFNPYKGYRWLTHLDGHWNYICVLHAIPEKIQGMSVKCLGKRYPFYHEYLAENIYVAGEFYWQARIGRISKFTEYVQVPNIVSCEVLYNQLNQKTYYKPAAQDFIKKDPTRYDARKDPHANADKKDYTQYETEGTKIYASDYSPLTGYVEENIWSSSAPDPILPPTPKHEKSEKPVISQRFDDQHEQMLPSTSAEHASTPLVSTDTQSSAPQAMEEIWSIAEYMQPEDVKEAFSLTGTLPKRKVVSINQPSRVRSYLKPTAIIALGFFALLCFSGIFNSLLFRPRDIFQEHVTFNTQRPEESSHNVKFLETSPYRYNAYHKWEYVSRPFKIDSRRGVMRFISKASVDNSWLEYDISLINDKTGDVYYISDSIERYHGYDDGYWSEGSQYSRVTLGRIPSGTYHIKMDVYTNRNLMYFDYIFREGQFPWGNFWLAAFLGLLPFGCVISIKLIHEAGREE